MLREVIVMYIRDIVSNKVENFMIYIHAYFNKWETFSFSTYIPSLEGGRSPHSFSIEFSPKFSPILVKILVI